MNPYKIMIVTWSVCLFLNVDAAIESRNCPTLFVAIAGIAFGMIINNIIKVIFDK